MDLFEYQGKQFFASFGIPVSKGEAVETVDDAVAAAERIGEFPVVIKAQVQVGGRGKAGGIKLANDLDEVRTHATNILGMDIKGHVVKVVWIEVASDIAEEYYASFTLDRSAKQHLGMLSAEGGVEIEAVAETNPDAIAKIWIDPVDGLTEPVAREWVESAKLNPDATDGAVSILLKLYEAYTKGDADLTEINPLILKPTGEVHALDAKVTLDNNAAFRHEWDAYEATQERDSREQAAHEADLQYVGLEGSVGIIANGAGLAMSTLDVVNQVGRITRQLPGRRRRSGCRQVRQGADDHRQRPPGEVDLHQHLRRHHPRRGGRQRHRDRARPDRHRVTDRHPPRRHQRGRGPRDPRAPPERPAPDGADHVGRGPHGRRARGSLIMSVFVDENTKVVYQGLTGSQGRYYGLLNREYGTQVVAGTNPKKAGTDVEGIPIFASVGDAVRETGANASCIFIPAPGVKDAVMDAAEGGVEFIVCITEGVPAQDEAWFYNELKRNFPNVRLLGPNCPGIISPGKCNIGITAGHIAKEAEPGAKNVGIVSRSGTLTYQALYELKGQGIGVTTCVGIGGDPVPGTSFIDCLEAFEGRSRDPRRDDDRRDRRLGGGRGGAVHRREDDEAGLGLHRRADRASRQEDGPRRRHRLGWPGHRRSQDGGPRGRGRQGRCEPDRGRRAHGRDRQGPLALGRLLDLHEVDHEHERLVRLDVGRRRVRPVGHRAGDDELAAAAFLHPDHALRSSRGSPG